MDDKWYLSDDLDKCKKEIKREVDRVKDMLYAVMETDSKDCAMYWRDEAIIWQERLDEVNGLIVERDYLEGV